MYLPDWKMKHNFKDKTFTYNAEITCNYPGCVGGTIYKGLLGFPCPACTPLRF